MRREERHARQQIVCISLKVDVTQANEMTTECQNATITEHILQQKIRGSVRLKK